MLKISHHTVNRAPAVTLEGKLLAPWVDEVRRHCEIAGGNGHALLLDLSGVLFVDQAGAALLRELQARGVRIVACSNYVSELLELEIEQ